MRDEEPFVDSSTGEVIEADERSRRAESIARELAKLEPALAEAQTEVSELAKRRGELERALRPLMAEDERVDGGSAWVVLEAPRRPAQRVSREGAERWREQLIGLGLGAEETVFKPPTISAVRAARAEIVAAGIPMVAIAPEPLAGPSVLKVVPK